MGSVHILAPQEWPTLLCQGLIYNFKSLYSFDHGFDSEAFQKGWVKCLFSSNKLVLRYGFSVPKDPLLEGFLLFVFLGPML